MMYPINNGENEIHPIQIVSAHKEPDGLTWRLFMSDDKTFVVTDYEYQEIRKLTDRSMKLVCNVE